MSQRVTMQQIAAEAGVSTTTVSRVLAGHSLVASETRERIQELIDRYQYTPNSVARSLVRQQSNMLGMLVQDIENPYFAAMYLQAERYANEQGYTLLMMSSLSVSSERESVMALLERQVDGLIMVSTNMDELHHDPTLPSFIRSVRSRVPAVLINEPVDDIDMPYVAPENYHGFEIATNYLLNLGHRDIAFVGGQDDTLTMRLRHAAYRDALQKHGVEPDESFTRMTGFRHTDGERAMAEILSSGRLPTAVLTVNELTALGVLKACAQQRLRVPDDISIISCDNSYICRALYPELTAVDIHPEQQGELAVKHLLQMLDGQPVPPVTRVPSNLVVRQSSASPARGEHAFAGMRLSHE